MFIIGHVPSYFNLTRYPKASRRYLAAVNISRDVGILKSVISTNITILGDSKNILEWNCVVFLSIPVDLSSGHRRQQTMVGDANSGDYFPPLSKLLDLSPSSVSKHVRLIQDNTSLLFTVAQ